HGGVGGVHGARRHTRFLRVLVRVAVERAQLLVRSRFGALADPARAARVERGAQPAADGDPVEAAVRAFAVADGLGGEDLFGFVEADTARALLVPDDPGHAVAGARERDVGLDAFARGVDVQARFFPHAGDAGLLPAEAADRRHVAFDFHAFGLHAVSVGRAGADRPLGEDLLAAFQARELLEADPRAWLRGIDRRAARHGRVFSRLVGVDVQRRDLHGFVAV